MTLKTWKKEFYPITAKQAARGSVIKAVKHSIQKWIGLRPSNLKKHQLESHWIISEIQEIDRFQASLDIMSDSCALCQKFVEVHDGDCDGCPLYESRGQVRCDHTGSIVDNPYGTWRTNGDPMPMIKALRKALKWAESQ